MAYADGFVIAIPFAMLLKAALSRRREIMAELRKQIVGQEDIINQVLLTLFVGGNSLIVGVPGLAKTLLINTIAQVLDLKFSRIQFTPDLMPSDITGTELLEEDHGTGKRSFVFQKGPIFANIVLADEINRAPPKTQAALLEAMQEHKVTAAGKTYQLPEPFFVLATQNPIEHEGTYPLPESQLDRFMLRLSLGYPTPESSVEILATHGVRSALDEVRPVTDAHVTSVSAYSNARLSSAMRTTPCALVGTACPVSLQ